MDINERVKILVTCGPGLEEYLEAEITALGYEIVNRAGGAVVTKGNVCDCMKLCLHLRCAYNVLYLLREFRCGNVDTLYKQAGQIAWEGIISTDEYVSIVGRVNTFTVNNNMYANVKVKDAIADRLTSKCGKRCDSGSERKNAVVNLFWKDDNAWLYLNMSGLKLSDRNYRKIPFKAPLRESLAAGLLMAAEYDGSSDIVLPMCGSGTLAIEAALIATSKAAGSLRVNYGFQHLKFFDADKWQEIRNEAKRTKANKLRGRIIATDIDPEAIRSAKQNAKTAGVDHLIEFGVCDFAKSEVPQDSDGIVLMNPEYGERLGDEEHLGAEYKRMGDFFKQQCKGYKCYIFTGNMALGKRVGLKTSKRMIFFNGKIECRLLKYDMY